MCLPPLPSFNILFSSGWSLVSEAWRGPGSSVWGRRHPQPGKHGKYWTLIGWHSKYCLLIGQVSMVGDQQLMFNINQLIVTVEAGLGNNTIPMILLESKLSGEVRNWSSRLSVLASTQVTSHWPINCVASHWSILFRSRWLTTTQSTRYGSQSLNP